MHMLRRILTALGKGTELVGDRKLEWILRSETHTVIKAYIACTKALKLKTLFIATLCIFMCSAFSYSQSVPAKDYLNVPGPLQFRQVAYKLAWTTHPQANYYKQEYLAPGQSLEKFKNLVTIDVLTGSTTPKDAAGAKIAELKQLKATNPIVNYQVFEKDGEVLLDFLISENTPDGRSVSVVERNVYRYKSFKDKNGKAGLLLFAASERAYGKDIDQFFAHLKAHHGDLLNAVAGDALPTITVTE